MSLRVVAEVEELRQVIDRHKRQENRIGFVPTMGYLHEGHLSLIRAARGENDFVVASIFVNPTQFGATEDLEKYPQDMERDRRLLAEEGTNLLFAPVKESLYPPGFSTTVRVEGITEHLCGASRPWHFPGVALVVCKLFNLVQPDSAYFGQKDFQQAQVIRRMVRDLDFRIEIQVCPIVREPDGLAMSSRNTYLKPEERRESLVLAKALDQAERLYEQGVRSGDRIRTAMRETLESSSLARVDYSEVVDFDTLHPAQSLEKRSVALVAAFFGSTRLIDNHVLGEPFPVRF